METSSVVSVGRHCSLTWPSRSPKRSRVALPTRPKHQRGLAESEQAPARSYFCSPRKAGVSSCRSTSLSKIVHSGSHAASRPRARSPTKPPAPCACSPAQMRRPASAFGLHRRRPTRTRVHAKAELGAGRHNGWTVERRPASPDWREARRSRRAGKHLRSCSRGTCADGASVTACVRQRSRSATPISSTPWLVCHRATAPSAT
jgi:hypothetical protein